MPASAGAPEPRRRRSSSLVHDGLEQAVSGGVRVESVPGHLVDESVRERPGRRLAEAICEAVGQHRLDLCESAGATGIVVQPVARGPAVAVQGGGPLGDPHPARALHHHKTS